MSTSPKPEVAGRISVELHEEEAEHVGAEFGSTRHSCRAALGKSPALRYVAHYSSGVFDFGVDALGDPAPAADELPGTTRRDELKRLGRHLSYVVSTLDRTLQEVRTGRLIRTVLHTEEGALFCDSVVPTEYVVGLVVDHAGDEPLATRQEIREADRAVSELAGALRAQVRLPSLNPGGWESADQVAALTSVRSSTGHHLTVLDESPDGVIEACGRAARPDDLHLVAYCARGEVAIMVDHLGDESLAPFFTQITVDARRRFYQGFGRELGALASRLNRAASTALGGLLVRLVLDVEMGAIYYYRLGPGEYLMGVTIDQERVSGADDRMSALARELTPSGP